MEVDKEAALTVLGITEQMYDELIGDFLAQFVLDINNLNIALEQEDFEQIRKIGHSIKGSAGNLRLKEISLTAKQIEQENKDKNVVKDKIPLLKENLKELRCLFEIK